MKMSSLLLKGITLVVFLKVVVESDNFGCPREWKQFGCSCFFFGSNETLSWTSARERCNLNLGSHLATISTREENNFVGRHINDQSWLGLRHQANGTLKLLGEGQASFFVWDNITAFRPELGCVAARPTRRRTWLAQTCSKEYKYICEKPASKESALCLKANWSVSFDRQGWSACPNSHPYIIGLERSREPDNTKDYISNIEAAQCCKAVSPYTSENSKCIRADWVLSFDRGPSWAECPKGYFLSGLYHTEGQYLHNIEYGNCCKPENHALKYENCYIEDIQRTFDAERAGMVTCQRPGYYVTGLYRSCCNSLYCLEKFMCCSMAENYMCPDGWKKFNSSCYQISKSALPFDAAQRECKKSEAFLAEISTQEENEFVLSSLTNETNEVAWFGLKKQINSATFRYSRFLPNYTAIGVVQPKSSPDALRCATMSLGTNDAVWIPRTCNEKHAYVCETNIRRGVNIAIPTVNETYAKVSWKVFGSDCDKLSPKSTYWFLLKQGNSTIFRGNIDGDSPIKTFGNLTPSTKYEVTITEAFKSSGITSRIFRHAFETSAVGNPLRVMTNLSSSSIKANLEESVILLCTGYGESPVTFTWFKDRKPITNSLLVQVQKPFPSSMLVIKLGDKRSFGKYRCQIRDRFSKKSHTVVVADLSADDLEKKLFIATVNLAVFLLILVFLVGYLTYKVIVKEVKSRIAKSELAQKDTGVNNTNIRLSNTGNPSVAQVSTPDDLQTDASYYTSLRRRDNETEENYTYCHLNKHIYENSAFQSI